MGNVFQRKSSVKQIKPIMDIENRVVSDNELNLSTTHSHIPYKAVENDLQYEKYVSDVIFQRDEDTDSD